MVTIWHNPRCSKSREALAYLEAKGMKTEVFKYLDKPLTTATLSVLLHQLGIPARELMRTKEAVYKDLGLQDAHDEAQLIEAMVANPRLIERPVVIYEGRAVVGRPLEKVAELLA